MAYIAEKVVAERYQMSESKDCVQFERLRLDIRALENWQSSVFADTDLVEPVCENEDPIARSYNVIDVGNPNIIVSNDMHSAAHVDPNVDEGAEYTGQKANFLPNTYMSMEALDLCFAERKRTDRKRNVVLVVCYHGRCDLAVGGEQSRKEVLDGGAADEKKGASSTNLLPMLFISRDANSFSVTPENTCAASFLRNLLSSSYL